MRKIILLFLLISFTQLGYSQIIKGRILDQYTDSTINFASVYFNGTFVGTSTNKNGSFDLDVSKYRSMPLTISALGYYSVSITNFSGDNVLSIYLTPKVFELNEVVVSAKGYAQARRENIRLFKQQFLGKTFNALKCEITNINDIILIYDSTYQTLKAFSSKPILIDNNALGYKITYYLDKFEYNETNQSLIQIGNYIFMENLTTDKKQNERIEKRRRSTYLGSRMHFFRALWEKELNSNGFEILNSQGTPAMYLVMPRDSITKYIKYRGDLVLNYFQKSNGSVISFTKDIVYFDKQGYFDPLGISWTGEMARQRIADLLPYEYSIKKTLR
jgi:hypothetical protein